MGNVLKYEWMWQTNRRLVIDDTWCTFVGCWAPLALLATLISNMYWLKEHHRKSMRYACPAPGGGYVYLAATWYLGMLQSTTMLHMLKATFKYDEYPITIWSFWGKNTLWCWPEESKRGTIPGDNDWKCGCVQTRPEIGYICVVSIHSICT